MEINCFPLKKSIHKIGIYKMSKISVNRKEKSRDQKEEEAEKKEKRS